MLCFCCFSLTSGGNSLLALLASEGIPNPPPVNPLVVDEP